MRRAFLFFALLPLLIIGEGRAETASIAVADRERAVEVRKLINDGIRRHTVSLTVYDVYDYRDPQKGERSQGRELGSGTLRIQGSGEIVGCSKTECLIITAGHVVAGGKVQVSVRFSNGQFIHNTEVLHHLQRYDYSFIFVRFEGGVPPEYQNIRLIVGDGQLLDPIIVAGYVMRGESQAVFSVHQGEINTDLMADNTALISAPVTASSSGSGVWNTDGKLLGIVKSFSVVMLKDRDIKMASPGSGIMLSARGIFDDTVRSLRDIPNCSRCQDALSLIHHTRAE